MLEIVIRLLAHLLVPMFAVGMAGSAIVVAITFGHDLVDFFEKDDPAASGNSMGGR